MEGGGGGRGEMECGKPVWGACVGSLCGEPMWGACAEGLWTSFSLKKYPIRFDQTTPAASYLLIISS